MVYCSYCGAVNAIDVGGYQDTPGHASAHDSAVRVVVAVVAVYDVDGIDDVDDADDDVEAPNPDA